MVDASRLSTGIAGLDEVLNGGLEPNRLYLIEGTPGTGKTTLALQFLLAGRKAGMAGLYVTLSETETELRSVAASHGWSLDGIDLVELVAGEEFDPDAEQSVLHPAELELGETTRRVMERLEASKPQLVVFDSLSEMRLLAQSALRYRRQVLVLKHFFSKCGCTVLMLDDKTADSGDLQLHSLAHGVVTLEQLAVEFGAQRRRLSIMKMRGARYRGGYHDFAIVPGGVRLYPRLVAREHLAAAEPSKLSTGNVGLDSLLGGGLATGNSLLLTGPAGVGKSSTTTACILAALQRGEKASYFLFDEGISTMLVRSRALGMELEPFMESGQLALRQIDPAEMPPGEFAVIVREAVEEHGASIIALDSLNGYMQSMPGEQHLMLQMHEMLGYLNQRGVVTLVVLGQHGIIGDLRNALDLSYLADGVMLMRYFEVSGLVRSALSVIKTRTTGHERSIREFRLGRNGIEVGEPLLGFTGVLSNSPGFSGAAGDLMNQNGSGGR